MTELPTTAATHMHDGAQPMHAASAAHQHGEGHQHHADAGGATHDHAKHQHDGKTSHGPCCAMLCVSAIAADPPAVAMPSPPISLCVSESFQRLRGEAPPLLYRPPIA
jgi:ABC-type Zn2+ transport system substrate-binding protein/surface adhesin